ncbi:MAG: hypothetical protein ACLRRT_17520 [Ruthenibacterium lactatiformans]
MKTLLQISLISAIRAIYSGTVRDNLLMGKSSASEMNVGGAGTGEFAGF